MPPTDLQSDAFVQLLADALRAGPGSPEWRQAVTTLREHDGSPAADDYQLLIAARERLESGRTYREIRPGPGFTRKVLEGVERQDLTPSRWRSPTTWIALMAAVTIITVGIFVGRFSSTADDTTVGLQTLAQTYFTQPTLVADFKEPPTGDFKAIGATPVTPSPRGLRLATSDGESADYTGGGLVTTAPVAPSQPFAVEVQLRARELHDDLIPQVFVTDAPDFAVPLGTTPHELTWLIKSNRPTVALPDGQFQGRTDRTLGDLRDPMTVRLLINDRFTVVEAGGERLFAGPHQLDPAKPRHVGVRFLRKGSNKQDHIAFESFKLLLPQRTP